jgi:glycosyltransferase involved in cell wall biosynthesis
MAALISVIVCSHNPRDAYLLRCLNGLRYQTLDTRSWELLLIDNASDLPLALKADISWHPNSRHIKEPTLGLVWARHRAIQESVGDLLIFVDDDNVLDPEYLFNAAQLGTNWPMLGTWGAGIISPEFEAVPAAHLRDFLHSLALRDVSTPRWTNVLPCAAAMPWGAGLCVRRSVAGAYRRLGQETKHLITGRVGEVLFSGDDLEICYVASKLGYGVGIFPELKVLHLIPKERISEAYLVGICQGTRISNMVLDYKWFDTSPRSPFSFRSLAALVKNVVTKRGIHRRMYIANWRAVITAKRILGM